MKISVVMSTYNGSRYIVEQMDSILHQTVRADEVLIFDDCSNDKTYEIVENYIQKHSLSNWKIQRNPQNYGWRKSFMNAICNATSDLIFTADQDDIWCRDKLEVMSNVFKKNSRILVLTADYQAFKYDNVPTSKGKIDSYTIKQIQCDEKWYYIKRPGCVFAFRKEIIPYMHAAWHEMYAHDALVWQLGILLDGLFHIDYTAIFFRRHDTNATPPNKRDRENRLIFAKQTLIDAQHIKQMFGKMHVQNNFNYVNGFCDFVKHRISLIQNRKFTEIFWLLRHNRYYYSIKSILVDAICALDRDT